KHNISGFKTSVKLLRIVIPAELFVIFLLDGIKLKIHNVIIYDRCYRLLKMIPRPFKHLFNFSLLSYIGLNSDGSGLPEFVDKCLGFVFTLKIVDDDVGSFSVKGVGNFTT